MKKILIVDDSPIFAKILSEIICRQMNSQVELDTVYDKEEALKKLSKKIYDLVITDLNFEDYDSLGGIDIVKKSLNNNCQCLVLSSYCGEKIKNKVLDLGAYFFTKMFNNSELLKVIKNLLEKKEALINDHYNDVNLGPILDNVPERIQNILEIIIHDLNGVLGLSASQLNEIGTIISQQNFKSLEDNINNLSLLSKETTMYIKNLCDMFLKSSVTIVNSDIRLSITKGIELSERFRAPYVKYEYLDKTSPIIAKVNSDLLTRIIMNVLRNAYESANPKGLVSFEYHLTAKSVLMHIGNTGDYIKEPNQIFEWGKSTKSRKHRGIGLAFCKKAIRLMKGDILYFKDLQVGNHVFPNAFKIILPIDKD